ncbi:MAG: DUF2073 domain-containing protein [Thermoplasmata archaeon]|nr:DUF2073 domain-containing protein [Thermoplasmata archaeon]
MEEVQESEGVRINLISSRKLDDMTSEQKLVFILEEVRRGTVLVLERGLTAIEEINLIKATMSAIDQDTFIGIEMQSYSSEDIRRGSWLDKLLRRVRLPRMTVIGPADLLKTIHKDGSMVQAMILTGKKIISEAGDAPPLAVPVEETEAEESMAEEPSESAPEDTEGEEERDEIDLETSEESEPEKEGIGYINKRIKDED